MTLADNLKRIREEKGLSQAGLARASGVSQQSISRLETGRDQTSKYLPRLAAALGCAVEDLDDGFAGVVAGRPSIAEALKIYSELPEREKKEFLQHVLGLADDDQT